MHGHELVYPPFVDTPNHRACSCSVVASCHADGLEALSIPCADQIGQGPSPRPQPRLAVKLAFALAKQCRFLARKCAYGSARGPLLAARLIPASPTKVTSGVASANLLLLQGGESGTTHQQSRPTPQHAVQLVPTQNVMAMSHHLLSTCLCTLAAAAHSSCKSSRKGLIGHIDTRHRRRRGMAPLGFNMMGVNELMAWDERDRGVRTPQRPSFWLRRLTHRRYRNPVLRFNCG